jgi:hypothetical protein
VITNGHGKPIVALDIDGTIADYHVWFLRFAEMWLGRPMPDPEANNPGLPLHRFMGVSKTTYRKVKLAYRQGGLKRAMPCLSGIDSAIRSWRRAGAEVWICTTRPYLRLDNIDPDTREWLRRNHIQYDAVLFGHNKYRELHRIVGPDRVVAVADDLTAMLEQAWGCGLRRLLLRDQVYNRFWDESSTPVVRWSTAEQLDLLVRSSIETWKEEHR